MRQKLLSLKNFFSGFGFIPLLYIFAFTFVYLLFYFLGYTDMMPPDANLVQWDAANYASIAADDYVHHWYEASNTAFFPLFPYVWRFLHVGQTGICIFNFIVFFAGLYILHKTFQVRSLYTLCFVSLPSAIFFFLPYTESLFFFFSALTLAGLHKENKWMILTGLFFCSITRATGMFFLPAIICSELAGACRSLDRQAIKNIIYYAVAALLGLAVVVFIQYAQTYTWFAFASQQMLYWGHKFGWPHLPFVTHSGDKILWLDGLALFFGMLAVSVFVAFSIKFFLKKADPAFRKKPFWFSVVYLCVVTFYSMFFNPRSVNGSTEIISMNRYFFATAFFFVFFSESLRLFSCTLKNGVLYFLIGLLAWLSLGLGKPLDFLSLFQSEHRTTIFFLCLLLYTFLVYFLLHRRYASYAGTVLFCLNLLLSVYVFSLFIHGKWVA